MNSVHQRCQISLNTGNLLNRLLGPFSPVFGPPFRAGMWALLIGVVLLTVCSVPEAQARVVSSTDLIEHAAEYDGERISFRGEVVGDIMLRGNHAWISVNDDSYSERSIAEGGAPAGYNSGHGIWVTADQARRIKHLGGYKHAGDIVRVDGVFNRACKEHGGDMDIHAIEVSVVKAGHRIGHPLQTTKAATASVLFLAAAGIFLLNHRMLRKKG